MLRSNSPRTFIKHSYNLTHQITFQTTNIIRYKNLTGSETEMISLEKSTEITMFRSIWTFYLGNMVITTTFMSIPTGIKTFLKQSRNYMYTRLLHEYSTVRTNQCAFLKLFCIKHCQMHFNCFAPNIVHLSNFLYVL